MFDNGATPAVEKFSRVLVLRLDETAHTATLVRSYHHPRRLLSPFEGNAQFLPNGHVFVGWGSNPDYTEFDERGHVVLDASFGRPGGAPGTEADSYRAYHFDWTGRPTDKPRAVVRGARLYASWNGATEVDRWDLLAGPSPDQLAHVRTVARTGFETAVPLAAARGYVAVRALAAGGQPLALSAVLKR